MPQDIKGIKDHPEIINLTEYVMGGPALDEEPLGGSYEITPGKSKNGLPTFVSAKKLP